jgi:glycosyltransferase involved in cell wall biosynthesis
MHNVLVDLHRLGGNKYNGLYHFCYQLGSHLLQAPSDNLNLHFYLPKSAKGIFSDKANYTIQRSRDKFFRFGTRKFDVWHVATTLSWYRPFNRKTKNIFTIHDLNFLGEEEYSLSGKKKYLRLIQQRVDRADHLTFISAFALRQAKEHLQFRNKPYSIIYNGCNIPLPVTKLDPGYKPAKPFLFTIGLLHSRKNFHVLPALLMGNDYELVIAGLNNFPYAEKVLSEAKKHGVEQRVKLIGPITEEEKNWYYQHCEAFVFPSVGEGFGMPVLEAMHFGKPVFLANSTSLPEVGGDAAYYFNNFDPAEMKKVFENGMKDYTAGNRIIAIRQQAERFSWDTTAQEYLTVYRSFV